MGLNLFGIKLPEIKLPKLDLGSIGKEALTKGVSMLKTVAKDMFTPAGGDAKTLFNPELHYKVGPLDIRLKNPVEVLAEKLLGKASTKLQDLGFNPDVVAKAIGGGKRAVQDLGEVELPALAARTKEIGGGASASSSSTATGSAAPDFASMAIDKSGGRLNELDAQIEQLLKGGGELKGDDLAKLQLMMQRRSELYTMLTQIMQLEHDTKKAIVSNIR